MSYKVLVTEIVFQDLDVEREVFAGTPVEMVVSQAGSPEEIVAAAEGEEIDALLTATHIPITETVFEGIDSLRFVSSYGIGVDHIDLEAANDHGIPVSNVPDYSIDEVSSHALALLLACARSVVRYDRHVDDGGWEWEVGAPIERLRGKTLGLVAFGKIARRVAEKAAGFDLEVVAYDPYVDADEMAARGVEKVGFEELLERSRYVSVHAPLTTESRGMFDADAFARMREESVLVNTARGPVVEEAALVDALEDGPLRAAGVDVFEEEPPEGSPLLDREDVLVTPHVAWYSERSREVLARSVARDVVRVLDGGEPEGEVDPDEAWR
jgi:D-3-phosphoglycerate dehydrogenase